ncbi:mitochondrial tRNA methylthiotransferase CDK5RAP1-like, partial [Prorops nasuta]
MNSLSSCWSIRHLLKIFKSPRTNRVFPVSVRCLQQVEYKEFYNTSCQSSSVNVENNEEKQSERHKINSGPGLREFIARMDENFTSDIEIENIPYLNNIHGNNQTVYFDIKGCQMNVNDTEIAWSILKSSGYNKINNMEEADIVLVVTCAIRDSAEQKVWNRLDYLLSLKKKRRKSFPLKIGLLGCMAKRLKDQILEQKLPIDVIAGPDSYKDLPRLLAETNNETGVNVVLSFDETYADIMPVRLNPDAISAYVSIMRGCDNMCTYCIVPFTRGKERSRPIASILDEIRKLSDDGIKEVTLLGQNVN